MKVRSVLLGCIVIAILSGNATAAEIRVPQDSNTIQEAIEQAADGDTVLVAPGIYQGPGNVEIDFQEKAITLASKSGPEVTIIDCNGASGGVRFSGGRDVVYRLVGFTIRNADMGIYCNDKASPLIEDCIVEHSTGVYPQGVFCFGYLTSPVLRNCIIRDCEGSGLYVTNSATPTLEGCVITGNHGGVYANAHVTFRNCLVYDNVTTGSGGGIYVFGSAPLTLINCTIVDNQAQTGGGVFAEGSEGNPVMIRNCIIRDNDKIPNFDSIKAQLRSGISEGFNPDNNLHLGYADVTYSNIPGGWPGEGNFDADSLFRNANEGDYRLHGTSPCVDAGDPSDDYSSEPGDGGNLINVGAYGNTSLAALYSIYPTITSVVPLQGYVAIEYQVVLTGVHFGDSPIDTELIFGDLVITEIESWQDNEIVCRAVFPEEGPQTITMTTSTGQAGTFPEPFIVYPEGLLELSGDIDGILGRGLMYLVTDDVNVPEGQELIVEPGALIFVDSNDGDDPYQFVVNGTLLARGDQENPILFTSLDETSNGSWQGLILSNNAWLEFCEISRARTGVRAESGNIIINNCHIYDCNEYGIYWNGDKQGRVGLVVETLIEDNGRSGLYSNGSIYSPDGGITSRCTIRGNGEWGIHAYARASSSSSEISRPVIEDCDVLGNADGGVYLEARSSIGSGWVDAWNLARVDPDITRCYVSGNGGPGISCYSRGNVADAIGGSVLRDTYTSPHIERTLVFANSGSGLSIVCGPEESYALPTISHCCFYSNGDCEMSIEGQDASVDLTNSIVSTVLDQYFDIQSGASVIATYCLFDGSGIMPEGEGNLQGDPQWIDPDNGDFSLMPTSPAIDAGACPAEGECDYFGLAPDIGAIEWQE